MSAPRDSLAHPKDQTVVCRECLKAGRVSLMTYSFALDLHVCDEHGRQVTEQFIQQHGAKS